MNQSSAIFYLLICSLFYSLPTFSQISGVVNQYTEVLSIDNTVNSVEVANATSFTTSDRVLLIQMKGATIDETNSTSFGDIININGAGSYEMGTVCDVVGNDILFSYSFENTYSPANGRIQLVKVYSGTDETVTAPLSASPWNGTTGGVVAIELSGTLTLNADIDVSEQGFRGAEAYSTTHTCASIPQTTGYFYPFNTGAGLAARKGEGISDFIASKEYGKGHQANGGGGGNDHNAGGGGGGNYQAGGIGGVRVTSIFNCKGNHPGLGGMALSGYGYSLLNNQVFLGGGGGAGEDNNDVVANIHAGDGGGIVLIIADQIEGNGNTIRSNGGSPLLSESDGGPGGGAGGTILLSTNTYGTSILNLEATGGNGGSNSINCEGPGGGGAGGVIWVSAGLTGLVSTDVTGGIPGIATGAACGSSNNGATAGSAGIVQNALSIPENIVTLSPCVLNSSAQLSGETTPLQTNRLYWDMVLDANLARIELERKTANGTFQLLAELSHTHHEWIDPSPAFGENIYQLKFINKDASLSFSNQVSLFTDQYSGLDLQASPNPLNTASPLTVSYQLPKDGRISISLWDLTGRKIRETYYTGTQGKNQAELNLSDLPIGTYFLKVDFQGKSEILKVFVQN